MGRTSLDVYYDAANPGSFGGVTRLKSVVKKDVKKWLHTQPTYTLHFPSRRRYPTRKYISKGIDWQHQADLMDLSQYSRTNGGYTFVLMNIDIFSRYLWARPLKSKSGRDVRDAFKDIYTEGRIPKRLQTDQGKEFFNINVKSLMKANNVHHFHVNSPFKAALVERSIRTIKSRLFRYFTYKKTKKWVDVLEKIIQSYNNSYHRSIGMRPNDVTEEISGNLWLHLYGDDIQKKKKDHLKVGDLVRLSKVRKTFRKGYLPNFTEELFTIHATNTKRYPTTYTIKDYSGDIIDGSFYSEELLKVYKSDNVYNIDKILHDRGKGKNKQYFVSWSGYPKEFNSWINASDIVKR